MYQGEGSFSSSRGGGPLVRVVTKRLGKTSVKSNGFSFMKENTPIFSTE